MIWEQVQKLEKILDIMLRFITPPEIHQQPADLNRIVLGTIERLKTLCRNGSFSMSADLDPELGLIPLDETLFSSALINLMENACQRMGEKGEMMLTTHQSGDLAVLTLTYGIYRIPDDDLEHYFYPFAVDYFPLKNGMVSDVVDVSISKVIIHKHGGQIQVSRTDDQHIRITLSLPLH
jgi:K+-sensing histidine kinase KdpD